MTRHTFRMLWIGGGIALIIAGTYLGKSGATWTDRIALSMLGGLMFWEWRKDK